MTDRRFSFLRCGLTRGEGKEGGGGYGKAFDDIQYGKVQSQPLNMAWQARDGRSFAALFVAAFAGAKLSDQEMARCPILPRSALSRRLHTSSASCRGDPFTSREPGKNALPAVPLTTAKRMRARRRDTPIPARRLPRPQLPLSLSGLGPGQVWSSSGERLPSPNPQSPNSSPLLVLSVGMCSRLRSTVRSSLPYQRAMVCFSKTCPLFLQPGGSRDGCFTHH